MYQSNGIFANFPAKVIDFRAGGAATFGRGACDTVVFDMDGTLGDLYAVDGWEPKLRAGDPEPYAKAAPLVDVRLMNDVLDELHGRGIATSVVSWLARGSSAEYDRKVIAAKEEWLRRYFPSLAAGRRHYVAYGTPKSTVAPFADAVLVDDDERNIAEWVSTDAYERIAIKAGAPDMPERLRAVMLG